MGAPSKAGWKPATLGAPVFLVFALLFLASSALAASPLKVREAYPGSNPSFPAAEFVEMQMSANGQNDIDGQVVQFYDAEGDLASTYTIPTDVANGQSQRTVLLATQEAVEHLPGLPAPDFNLGSGTARMDPAGGGVCLTGAMPDCVTWGSIPLATIDNLYLPDGQVSNAAAIANGFSLTRRITGGCATYLDAADDTNNSQSDFAQAAPTPRSNATAPSEKRCPPDTLLNAFPPNPTNQTSATFTYDELPQELGASFECKLDAEAFASCSAGAKSYPGPLPDGTHTFSVKAIGEGGADQTPKTYTWTIDTVAPDTIIDSTPPEPSGGFSAPFTYHSTEPSSSFKCQLDSGPIQTCPGSGKAYFLLEDGSHVFRVWATDNAGNADPTPAEHVFTVQGVLIDRTPPDTLIVAAPSNPSPSDSATFAYASTEQGSTFECSLNGSPFRSCPASGETYTRLRNGSYIFSVRATDPARNTDSVPASYPWTVAAPLPNTRFTKAPPGRTTIAGKKATLTFGYRADKPGSTFRCRVDKQAFKPCASTAKVKAPVGRHRFEVYAIDALGNAETTPARRIFRVQQKRQGGLF